MDRRNYALILILLLASSPAIYSAYYAWAAPAPSIGATVEPGSLNRPCDFVVYQDGATTLAVNAETGVNDYSSTAAGTTIQNTIDNGDVTCFKPGTYTLANQSPPAGVGY